jgi:hypothetical protein
MLLSRLLFLVITHILLHPTYPTFKFLEVIPYILHSQSIIQSLFSWYFYAFVTGGWLLLEICSICVLDTTSASPSSSFLHFFSASCGDSSSSDNPQIQHLPRFFGLFSYFACSLYADNSQLTHSSPKHSNQLSSCNRLMECPTSQHVGPIVTLHIPILPFSSPVLVTSNAWPSDQTEGQPWL